MESAKVKKTTNFATLRRLRTRLLLVTLLAITPAIGAIIYSGIADQRTAYEQARREAIAFAHTVSATYRQATQQTQDLVATLSQVEAVRAGSPAECHAFVDRILRQNPSLANIGVIDARGYLTCSAVPHREPVYLGDRAYFRQAGKLQEQVTSSFEIGRVVAKPMVVFAAPLKRSPAARQKPPSA